MRLYFFHHMCFCLTFLSALTLFSFGCGQSGIPVEYVRGVVTLDGTPLEGATVIFSPKASEGMVAAGRTESDGSFTLNAQGAKPGAGQRLETITSRLVKLRCRSLLASAQMIRDMEHPNKRNLSKRQRTLNQQVIVPEKYNNV